MNDFSTRQLENQCRVSPTVTALVMTLRLVRSAVISTGSPRSLLSAIIQKRARVFCTLTSTSLAYPEHFRGWLLKWTNYIKGYWKRWFVLSNGLLSYYRSYPLCSFSYEPVDPIVVCVSLLAMLFQLCDVLRD